MAYFFTTTGGAAVSLLCALPEAALPDMDIPPHSTASLGCEPSTRIAVQRKQQIPYVPSPLRCGYGPPREEQAHPMEPPEDIDGLAED